MLTSLTHNTRRPDISFYRSGRIDITARVAKSLGLQDGDVIDVACEGGEYYLYIRYKGKELTGSHRGQCHATNSGNVCNNFRAYSKQLCRIVLRLNGNVNVARLPVGQTVHREELGTGIAAYLIIRNNLSHD
jgi:hypothetical protein